jgi:metallo-beta-lactamase family protein
VVMNGFSAHADQKDLVDYATSLRDRGALTKIALVHGETGAQDALIAKMKERGLKDVIAPAAGTAIEV